MPFTFNPFTGNFDNTPSTKDVKSVYTTVNSNSAEWDSVYTTVQEKSATEWDNTLSNQYTHSNFLPLSGGDLSGSLGITSKLSLTGYNNSEIIFTGRIINEDELVQVINGNQFLKIIVNNENKMIRLYDLNFPWITENGDNIINNEGDIIKL